MHDRARRRHPGALRPHPGPVGRDPHRAPGRGPGWSPTATVRSPSGATTTAGPAGYVVHRVEQGWHATGAATLGVVDLQATTPAAYTELWRHLCSQDLVGTVALGQASVDEPLPWLLDDHRAVHVDGERGDALAAGARRARACSSARRYPLEDVIVLDVADDAGFTAGSVAPRHARPARPRRRTHPRRARRRCCR